MTDAASGRLRKELGLFDVYAISTGAMFSSGFFLLPGLAAAATGPSVPLAYLVAGILIVPAMLSVAELATAMPRAGGAYYFLDRSLGPLVGTVGGLGTWLALVLKTAFALVGMGAYLSLYVDVAVEPLALVLTVLFMVVNIGGAKETSGLQRVLVSVLLVVMLGFVLAGWFSLATTMGVEGIRERFTPFLAHGTAGFAGTVGLVFVSYAGLTKVASVAEEVRDPDRSIPLGMALSLATAAFVYTVGVFIIVALLPDATLLGDLTPVATAAAAMPITGLPAGLPVLMIVAAAIAAFASTGNAGILAASRYPLAMGRDGLVPASFSRLGRFRTPTRSIVLTSALIGACILFFDVSSIAKLASAFQLALFSLLSLGVVIMRESGIRAYDPGFRSPLYPWMQFFGMLAPLWLIAEMGQLAILFTLGLATVTTAWYFWYARARVTRSGAILHAFARLGALRHEGLEGELRGIVRERGLRTDDPFDEIVARAPVLDFSDPVALEEVVEAASDHFAEAVGRPARQLRDALIAGIEGGGMPIAGGVGLPHGRVTGVGAPTLLLARCRSGLEPGPWVVPHDRATLGEIRALIFLLSDTREPTQHLRMLGHLAAEIEEPGFMARWLDAEGEPGLKAALLEDDRILTLRVGASEATRAWEGRPLHSVALPEGTLVALVRRGDNTLIPSGATELRAGDQLTLIGEVSAIQALRERD